MLVVKQSYDNYLEQSIIVRCLLEPRVSRCLALFVVSLPVGMTQITSLSRLCFIFINIFLITLDGKS